MECNSQCLNFGASVPPHLFRRAAGAGRGAGRGGGLKDGRGAGQVEVSLRGGRGRPGRWRHHELYSFRRGFGELFASTYILQLTSYYTNIHILSKFQTLKPGGCIERLISAVIAIPWVIAAPPAAPLRLEPFTAPTTYH